MKAIKYTGSERGNNPPVLWMLIPCYNEEEVLPLTAPMFLSKLRALISEGKIADESRVLFVDDGSKDNTWSLIRQFSVIDPHYIGIRQSRNRGHQNAVLAGLMEAKSFCDLTISIDCDGQDDLNAMDEMLEAYLKGAEIVYGVRSNRETDSRFKRLSAEGYYRLMRAMGAEVVFNHADYRLVSSKVLHHFANYKEVNLFLRGLFPLVGFPTETVYYERNVRLAGETHYPLRKMLQLGFDGVTSLSIRPIRIISTLGIVVSILGFVGIVWVLWTAALGKVVSGWASTLCIVLFMGGIQLISLGVIGEYIGKIYLETKGRPRYIISERTWEEKDSNGYE